MAKNIVVFSHRRSGTHLTIDAIRNNFEDYSSDFLNLDELQLSDNIESAMKHFTDQKAASPRVIKSHAPADVSGFFPNPGVSKFVLNIVENSKIIYVFRDGRDVMTSFFYYTRDVKPELRSVSFSEFLRTADPLGARPSHRTVGNVEYWRDHVSNWLDHAAVLPVSFESLVLDFDRQLSRLADHLEQRLPGSITRVVRSSNTKSLPSGFWNRSREKITKLYLRAIRGVDLTSVHFRSGEIGSYKENFSASDLRYFDEVAGPLMRRLNYVG